MIPLHYAFTIWQGTGCGSEDTGSGCGINSIVVLIGNFIRLGLVMAGALAVIFIIVGGFQYITSAGNPAGIARAKSTFLYAIIGLVVAMFAFAIVNFIIARFTS